MDTQNTNFTPAPDQRARAEDARLDPNDPAKNAKAGTPDYGDFGKSAADGDANAPKGRSGSNDNPDEFSAIRDEAEAQDHPDHREDQPGHVNQNQDTAAVVTAEASGADTDTLRAAWSKDDPRYAGGGSNNAAFDEAPDEAERNARAVDKSDEHPA